MSRAYTTASADSAEGYGAAIAQDCLDDMLTMTSQGPRMARLQTAILELRQLSHPKRAAGGFAVAMVNAIEIGLGLSK